MGYEQKKLMVEKLSPEALQHSIHSICLFLPTVGIIYKFQNLWRQNKVHGWSFRSEKAGWGTAPDVKPFPGFQFAFWSKFFSGGYVTVTGGYATVTDGYGRSANRQ